MADVARGRDTDRRFHRCAGVDAERHVADRGVADRSVTRAGVGVMFDRHRRTARLADADRNVADRQAADRRVAAGLRIGRSEEHTSELQSLMRISYAVFCLKKKNTKIHSACPTY